MTLMRQFGLAALFVIGVALFTSTPALAVDFGTIELTNRGLEPGASGQATLTNVTFLGFGSLLSSSPAYPSTYFEEVYKGELTVTLEGLSPGATYRIGPTARYLIWWLLPPDSCYYHFTASNNGTAEVAVPANFRNVWRYYLTHLSDSWEGDRGHYKMWQGAYGFYVERKAGKNTYTKVLYGRFSIGTVMHLP